MNPINSKYIYLLCTTYHTHPNMYDTLSSYCTAPDIRNRHPSPTIIIIVSARPGPSISALPRKNASPKRREATSCLSEVHRYIIIMKIQVLSLIVAASSAAAFAPPASSSPRRPLAPSSKSTSKLSAAIVDPSSLLQHVDSLQQDRKSVV